MRERERERGSDCQSNLIQTLSLCSMFLSWFLGLQLPPAPYVNSIPFRYFLEKIQFLFLEKKNQIFFFPLSSYLIIASGSSQHVLYFQGKTKAKCWRNSGFVSFLLLFKTVLSFLDWWVCFYYYFNL